MSGVALVLGGDIGVLQLCPWRPPSVRRGGRAGQRETSLQDAAAATTLWKLPEFDVVRDAHRIRNLCSPCFSSLCSDCTCGSSSPHRLCWPAARRQCQQPPLSTLLHGPALAARQAWLSRSFGLARSHRGFGRMIWDFSALPQLLFWSLYFTASPPLILLINSLFYNTHSVFFWVQT